MLMTESEKESVCLNHLQEIKEPLCDTVSAQIERHSRLERHVGKTQIKRQSEIKRN